MDKSGILLVNLLPFVSLGLQGAEEGAVIIAHIPLCLLVAQGPQPLAADDCSRAELN